VVLSLQQQYKLWFYRIQRENRVNRGGCGRAKHAHNPHDLPDFPVENGRTTKNGVISPSGLCKCTIQTALFLPSYAHLPKTKK